MIPNIISADLSDSQRKNSDLNLDEENISISQTPFRSFFNFSNEWNNLASLTSSENELQKNKWMSLPKRIILNLRGIKYEILTRDLKRLPSTSRLGRLIELMASNNHLTFNNNEILNICDDYDSQSNEFYFNRDPLILNMILDYLNTNKLHMQDSNMCIYKIIDEFNYWNIDESMIEPCCSIELNRRKNTMDDELLKREQILQQSEFDESFNGVCLAGIRREIWNVFEQPNSSIFATIYFVFLFLMILLSTLDILLRTIPEYKDSVVFDYTEIVCISWFTFEWILRFIIYPRKIKFLLSPLNIADLISIVPFYVYLGFEKSDIIEIIKNISRTFRSFSVLKIMKHSSSVQILSNTLKYSYKEIGVYLIYLGIGILTFSCFVYYAESGRPNTKFVSIPSTFW